MVFCSLYLSAVMAVLVTAIHVFANAKKSENVDARDKPGHDDIN
jgi:hypothetical protein